MNAVTTTNLAGFTQGNESGGSRSQVHDRAGDYIFRGALSAAELQYFREGYVKPQLAL